jgi:type I restriction enzyme S subunit
MAIKKGYKQTEVGVIPEDWDVTPLSTCVDLRSGHHVLAQFCNTTGEGTPYITGPADFPNGKIQLTKFTTKPGTICKRNDILVTVKGSGAGTIVLADSGYCISRQLMAITIREWDRRFVFSVLEQHTSVFGAAATGLIPGLSRGDILHCLIPLPPTLTEQEAIAGALSDADAWIESLEQLIAKKRQIKQGAMQELLTGKRRLPGFSGEWETKRLGELARLYQPTTISASSFTTFGFPVYGANGIVGYYPSCNHTTWQVTVTCRGSTCGTVNKTVDKCWITGNAMVLNCDHNHELDKSFLFHLLSDQDLTVCITGTGQPQIVRTPLAAVELRLPRKISEQQAIATVLSDMDTEIESLELKLVKAREVKQGMMQELLTGRIRLV